MSATWRSLLRDERGFVITAELVLISTVLVLGLVVALSAVKTAIAGELGDVAGAIGSANQTYYTHGFSGHGSRVYGTAFLDEADSSDELKADFATGIQDCKAPVVTTGPASCATAPCPNPPCATPPCDAPCPTPCNPPCETPLPAPCNGCETQLPSPARPVEAAAGTPCGSPCGAPCGTPCGEPLTVPCGSGCATQIAAGYGAPYGPRPGCGSDGYGSSYQVIEGWSRFGQSVPSVICPPGPGPFTGTDPFAPGVVSPRNMYLQGISYRGVCAPPVAPSQSPAPCLNPEAMPSFAGTPMQQGGLQPPVMAADFNPAVWPEEATHPTGYEGPSEPAFLPPQGRRGTVY